MITKRQIIDAWAFIRKNNNTIPDEVIDFMKDAAMEKIESIQVKIDYEKFQERVIEHMFKYNSKRTQ